MSRSWKSAMAKASWVAVAMGVGGAAPAGAELGVPDVSLSGGLTIPAGPASFTDLHAFGLALAGGLRYRLVPLLSLNLEVGYYRMPFDTGAFEKTIATRFPNINVSGNDTNVIPVTLAFEVPLPVTGSTRPYLSAGGGFYHVGSSAKQVSGPNAGLLEIPSVNGNVLGLRFGAGLRTPLTPLASLFLDASYHIALTNPDHIRFVPLRLGVRF